MSGRRLPGQRPTRSNLDRLTAAEDLRPDALEEPDEPAPIVDPDARAPAPDTADRLTPAEQLIIDYGGEYEPYVGGPSQGTNIKPLNTDALSGWDNAGGVHDVGVEMLPLSGTRTSTGNIVRPGNQGFLSQMDSDLGAQFRAAGVHIRQESDSYLDSNGDYGTGANQDPVIGGDLTDADALAALNDPDYARVEERVLPDPGGTAGVDTAPRATLEFDPTELDSDDEYNELLTDTEEVFEPFDDEELSASELTQFGEPSVLDDDGGITPFGTDPGEEPSFEDSVDEPSFSDTRVEGEPAVGGGRGPVMEPRAPDVDPFAVEPMVTSVAGPQRFAHTDDLDFGPGWGDQMPGGEAILRRPAEPSRSIWSRMFGRKQSELREPLLGRDTEMVPLNQRPSSAELVPPMGASEIDALNTLISDQASRQHTYTDLDTGGLKGAAMGENMGIGLGGKIAGGPGAGAYTGLFINKTTFGGWLAKQGKGLLAAPAVYVLTTWLNSMAPGTGDYVSLGLMVGDLVTSGDPLGVVAYGLGQLYAAGAEARQKVIDNDVPDEAYGTRMGYVREGDTWYPAFYNKKFESTGMFASDNNMTMTYGTDLVWMQDGQGGWEPYFTDGRTMDFVAQDNELNKEKSAEGYRFDSKEAVDDRLSTRDWYFLSDEDAKAVISGQGDFSFDPYYEDATKIVDGHRREVNDWRKALEMSQDWKWSSAVHALGQNAHVNEYEGSRELHRLMRESNDGMQDYTKFNADGTPESYEDYKRRYQQGKPSEVGAAYDAWDATQRPLTSYIFKDVLPDHIKALYKAQRLAAAESGFDKLYTNEWYNDNPKSIDKRDADYEGQTVWSSMYLDTSNDFPLARTSEDLAEQLDQIELMDDRTAAQRNYLAQKVQTRYWMQQASDMGQTSEMMHMLYGRDFMGTDPYNMRTSTLTAMRTYKDAAYQQDHHLHVHDYYWEGGKLYGFDESPGEDLNVRHLAEMPGWVAPWQNAGEGILPDFSRGDDYGMQDLMTSYRWAAFERMSTEAQDNAADWIKRTSGYDPNLVISQGKKVDMDTSGRSILESPDSYEDAAAKLARAQAASAASGFPDAPVAPPKPEVKPDPVVPPDEVVKPPEPVEAETFEEMMQQGAQEAQEEEDDQAPEEDDEPNYHQQWADKRAREEVARQKALDAKRLRHAYWVEQNRQLQEDANLMSKGKRGKADIEDRKAHWDWEQEVGLWAWDEDVPDPYANSHVPDAVPDNMQGLSVLLPESIDHEEQSHISIVPATSTLLSAVAALEAGPTRPSSMQLTGSIADPATAWSGPMPTYQGPTDSQVAGQNLRDWYTRAKMEASAQGLLGGMASNILGVVPQSLGGTLGVDPTPVKTI